MHYRLLVTTGQARSSLDARNAARLLLPPLGFVIDETQLWPAGIADWFVIGGRYTGTLARISDAEWSRRDHGAELGYPDDAQLVTEELYDRFLAPQEEWPDESAYVDLERTPLSRRFIGWKWLVVVDYHR
jgi:hypothetical protein